MTKYFDMSDEISTDLPCLTLQCDPSTLNLSFQSLLIITQKDTTGHTPPFD